MKHLDPRFGLIADVIDDPTETSEMREAARRHAETIASQCGFTFDEAMAHARLSRTAAADDAPAAPEDQSLEPESDPTDEDESDESDDLGGNADEPDGQIAAALKANPERADRDIARECSASPTTVGKLRKALGLGAATRTVTRGRTAYPMAVGDR